MNLLIFLEQPWVSVPLPVASHQARGSATLFSAAPRPPAARRGGESRTQGHWKRSCPAWPHVGLHRTIPLKNHPRSVYLVLGGANKRGASLRLATCPGLGEQRSRLNQSRWGSSIPCCRHHVSPAGGPSRGALRVRGVGGVGCQSFPATQPGTAGRRKSYVSKRWLWTWGVTLFRTAPAPGVWLP